MLALLLARGAGAPSPPSSCSCAAGFPPLPAAGYKQISGSASCVINYVQFRGASGSVVYSSGSRSSGGQPFSITCPGTATITSFSFICNAHGGPNGSFPTPKFASLTVIGGAACSDGSAPLYSGTLNGNVCVLGGGYTQVGFLDCGAAGSAPESCAAEGGECVPGASSHAPCAGTTQCSVRPPPPPPAGGPWPMMFADAAHSNTGPHRGPASPAIAWRYGLQLAYGVVVGTDVRAPHADVVFATTDQQTTGAPPPSGGLKAITAVGMPAWQWLNPDGGYMDCAPAVGADGSVFLGETNFHRVSPNGTLLWTVPLDANGPYASSSVLGPDGTLYFATSSFETPPQAFAYAITPNGTVRWSVPTGALSANVHAPPAVSRDGGCVYFNWASSLHAVSAVNGSAVWSVGVDGECSPSVGADGTVFCGTAAFSAGGAALWAAPAGDARAATFVAPAADGRLYGLGADGRAYCLLAANGSVVWAAPAGAGGGAATAFVLGAAAPGGGASMYVRAGASVVALARSSGAQQWSIDLPDADDSQAAAGFAMMTDGTLLFSTSVENSWLYAIGEAAAPS